MVLAVLIAALGRAANGVPLPAGHLLATAVTLIVGALALCVLGCLFTVVIRKATTAMPILFAVTLFFMPGNFFDTD